MDHIRLIAWADTHWDELGAKCVTIEDSEEVERAIFHRAAEGKFDFTLFAGDRFHKREPHDEVKVRADRVMYDCVHKGSIPHYHLVGNHCWTSDDRRWHTSESLKLFDNIEIMEESKTYSHGENVLIHALPADFELDLKNYEFDNDSLNIFIFHDTVRGTYMNEDKTMAFNKGLDVEQFDIPQFNIVLAGDIHVRQKFNLKHTGGGYLGSVTQRNRGDSNQERGWTEITATRQNPSSSWVFDVKFVPTKNLFTRISCGIDDKTQFSDLHFDESDFVDQFVEVKLIGNKANVDRIADDDGWLKLQKQFKPRRIETLRAYETLQSDVAVDLSSSNGVLDDLDLYLKSGFASLGNIDSDKVADFVRRLKRQEGPIQ